MRRAALPSSGLYPLSVHHPDVPRVRRRGRRCTGPASPPCTSPRWCSATASSRTVPRPGRSPEGWPGWPRSGCSSCSACCSRPAELTLGDRRPRRGRRPRPHRSSPGRCRSSPAPSSRPCPVRELSFLSWAGLRGAVPIVLTTIPLAEGVDDSERLFNIVFVMVVIYTLLTGTDPAAGGPGAEGGASLGAARPRGRGGAARADRRRPAAGDDQPGVAGCTASRSASCDCPSGPRSRSSSGTTRSWCRSGVPSCEHGDDLLVVTPRKLREQTEERLRQVSSGGRLAQWLAAAAARAADPRLDRRAADVDFLLGDDRLRAPSPASSKSSPTTTVTPTPRASLSDHVGRRGRGGSRPAGRPGSWAMVVQIAARTTRASRGALPVSPSAKPASTNSDMVRPASPLRSLAL